MITYIHPQANREMLGLIPNFLSPDDSRPAAEQFDANYQHGGGWRPYVGFAMLANGNLKSKYPEDPDTRLLAEIKLREELIRIYEHAWVAVVQPDGTFTVARMD